jgi:hypothetical protein
MKFLKKILVPLMLLASISLSAQTKVACILGDTVALNLSGTRGDIQWQISNDSISWTDLVGQQSEQLEFISTLPTQWLRAAISENNCPPFYEHPIFVHAVDTTSADFDPLIIVMDTVTVQFMPDSAQQTLGTYNFVVTGSYTDIDPGDILIGTEDRGFLVSVDYLIRSNNQLLIQTHNATLDDIFGNASIAFETLMDSLEQRELGVQLSLNNLQLINNGNASLEIPNLTFSSDGIVNFTSEYDAANGLTSFLLNYAISLNVDGSINIQTNAASSSPDQMGTFQAGSFEKINEIEIDNKPVLFTTLISFSIEYNILSDEPSCSLNAEFSSQADIGYWAEYDGDSYISGFDFDPTPNFNWVTDDQICTGSSYYYVSFQTTISTYLYNQKLDDCLMDLDVKYDYQIDPFLTDYKKTTTVEYGLADDPNYEVLGGTIDGDPVIPVPIPPLYEYIEPYELVLISGDNQVGAPGLQLQQPIVVQVKNNLGNPIQGVTVYADVLSGGGAVNPMTNQITDAEGKVSIGWTLGNQTQPTQTIRLKVRYPDLSEINGSPLLVNASFPPPLSLTYSGFISTEQAIWNTPTTTLHALGGVPPYQYNFFENCGTWSSDSVINYPADGIIIDSCGNQNFLYGGQYAMRVRDAVGTIDTVLVFIDRERVVVNTTTTGCNVAPGATWLLYAGISITSPNACFDLQEGSTLSAWIYSSAIPDWWYGGGFGGGLGYANNWNDIAASETPWHGLKVDYGINGSCLTSYNSFVTFYTNNTAPTCPGASCSYRVRFFGPNATNAASPTRWIWSNVITHTW